MHVGEKKIDTLIRAARENSKLSNIVRLDVAQLQGNVKILNERVTAADLHFWAAARGAHGLETAVWDEKYSIRTNFDGLLESNTTAPTASVGETQAPIERLLEFVARHKSWRAYPFSISCGPDCVDLVESAFEEVSRIAPAQHIKIGVFQIANRDDRLCIDLEIAGLNLPTAGELMTITDLARTTSLTRCEICGDQGLVQRANGKAAR